MQRSPCALAIGLAAALAAGCSPPPLEAARDRALGFFAAHVERGDPSWLPIFAYLERRFGVAVRDARGRALGGGSADVTRPELLGVYERLFDPHAAVSADRIAALPSAADRMTALALHCDRLGLPSDWLAMLGQATDAGGYALTQAAVAGQWTLENGCLEPAALRALQARQIEALAALAGDRAAAEAGLDAGRDVWIEALALLHNHGAGSRVERAWVLDLARLQRDDGGFARGPRAQRSDPHATALALWVLLETLEPDAPEVAWIPPR